MSFARVVSASALLLAVLGQVEARAQYRQPWVGGGVRVRGTTGHDQVLVAGRPAPTRPAAPRPAARRHPTPVAGARGTTFTIRVENISRGEVLKLSNGKTAPFVSAPVLWAVHTGYANPIFTGGQPDGGQGLETLAETGNPGPLARSLRRAAGVVAVGADHKAVGATAGGPITRGQAYAFDITAAPGQYLSTAWMFGQSNDLFYSNGRPFTLFDASGKPVSGDMTPQLSLWDAGTEVNEEPGAGPNQGPRQKTPDAGIAELQAIAHARDRYTYPTIGAVLRMTITPAAGPVSSK